MTESNTTTTATSAALPRFLDAFFAGRRNKLNSTARMDARKRHSSGHESEAPLPMRAERGMPGMA